MRLQERCKILCSIYFILFYMCGHPKTWYQQYTAGTESTYTCHLVCLVHAVNCANRGRNAVQIQCNNGRFSRAVWPGLQYGPRNNLTGPGWANGLGRPGCKQNCIQHAHKASNYVKSDVRNKCNFNAYIISLMLLPHEQLC